MNWNPFKRGHHGSRQGNPDTGSGAAAAAGTDAAIKAAWDAMSADLTRACDAMSADLTRAFYTGSVYSTSDAGTSPRVTLPTETRDCEIVAWRGWRLFRRPGEGAFVRSCGDWNHPGLWPGPTLIAHQKPVATPKGDPYDNPWYIPVFGFGHGPGIYACPAKHFEGSGYDAIGLIGEVALSGRVIEHERGYRAERATIRRLYLRSNWADLASGQVARGEQVENPEAALAAAGLWDVSPLIVAGELADRYQCEVELLTGDARPWMEAA